MRLLFCLLVVFVSVATWADDDDIPIDSSSQLREWCKAETEAHFVAQDITPHNWSASWWEEGNILMVEGSWLVGNDHVVVKCRVAKGAKTKYAIYEFVTE